MAQRFEVKLMDTGPDRLPVLARARPLMGLPPGECRSAIEAGPTIVARCLGRAEAEDLATELRWLGATAEIAICGCGCSDGPDHFHRP